MREKPKAEHEPEVQVEIGDPETSVKEVLDDVGRFAEGRRAEKYPREAYIVESNTKREEAPLRSIFDRLVPR